MHDVMHYIMHYVILDDDGLLWTRGAVQRGQVLNGVHQLHATHHLRVQGRGG